MHIESNTKPLLPWKSKKPYVFLYADVCFCARTWMGTCACVHVCVAGWECKRACACAPIALLIQHATRYRTATLGPSASTIFQNYLISGMISKKINIKPLFVTKYAFWFSVQLLIDSHSKNNSAIYFHKCEKMSPCKVTVILVGF
jgi:hypothetical protein